MSKLLKVFSLALLALSLLAATGCASQVGSVVEAPQVKYPPLPALVESTEPQLVGYFVHTMTDCLNSDACDAQATLQQLLAKADVLNLAFASCKADSQTLRGQGAPADYSLGGGKLPSK